MRHKCYSYQQMGSTYLLPHVDDTFHVLNCLCPTLILLSRRAWAHDKHSLELALKSLITSHGIQFSFSLHYHHHHLSYDDDDIDMNLEYILLKENIKGELTFGTDFTISFRTIRKHFKPFFVILKSILSPFHSWTFSGDTNCDCFLNRCRIYSENTVHERIVYPVLGCLARGSWQI